MVGYNFIFSSITRFSESCLRVNVYIVYTLDKHEFRIYYSLHTHTFRQTKLEKEKENKKKNFFVRFSQRKLLCGVVCGSYTVPAVFPLYLWWYRGWTRFVHTLVYLCTSIYGICGLLALSKSTELRVRALETIRWPMNSEEIQFMFFNGLTICTPT